MAIISRKWSKKRRITEILQNLEPPPWRKFGKPEDLSKNTEIEHNWQKIRELARKRERDQLRGKNFPATWRGR